ncbi:hypothetical protein GF373_17090 [bacterium]|nr:hypothetical protein [bacterium]
MKNKWFLISLVLFAILIVALLSVLTWDTKTKSSNVEISFSSPKHFQPTFDDTPIKKLNNKPAVSTPERIPKTKSKNIGDITNKHEAPLGQESLLIRDAMGQPIPSGEVRLGTQALPFKDGRVSIPNPLTSLITVQATAEGYFPAEEKIAPTNKNIPIISMEYRCNFAIQVFESNGTTPSPSTTVKIWKAANATRPIPQQCNTAQGTFALQGFACVVAKAKELHDKVDKSIYPHGTAKPMVGDRVVTLGHCSWFPASQPRFQFKNIYWKDYRYFPYQEDRSSQLRIWDALCLSARRQTRPMSPHKEKCEIMRGQKRGFYRVGFPLPPKNLTLFREGQTDASGIYRVEGVRTGLYYAQAIKRGERSEPIALHPACGGVKLTLAGKSRVSIHVMCEGLEDKHPHFSNFNNALVKLQSKKVEFGVFEGTTQKGTLQFKDVPYGEYRLTVEAGEIPIERDILIQKPNKTIDVKVPDWEQYRLAGVVLREDTREPVAGYELLLSTNVADFGKTTTDAQGRFAFPAVPPDMYKLTGVLTDTQYQFYPLEKHLHRVFPHEYVENISYLQFIVRENVENLQVVVKAFLETPFSGAVTDENGAPLAGMRLRVSQEDGRRGYIQTFPANPLSDEQGRFSFKIISRADVEETYQPELAISAMSGETIPPHWEPREDDAYHFVKEKFQITNMGVIHVTAALGEPHDGLAIIVRKQGGGVVQGQLYFEEEFLENAWMYATQNGRDLTIQKNKQGIFRIENVFPGEVALTIYPTREDEASTPFGDIPYRKYLKEELAFTLPRDKETMFVDIHLRQAGYMWGVVKNQQGKAVRDLYVKAVPPEKGSNAYSPFKTNTFGFFFIDALSREEQYQIRVYRRGNEKPIYQSKPLRPNKGNLDITIKE